MTSYLRSDADSADPKVSYALDVENPSSAVLCSGNPPLVGIVRVDLVLWSHCLNTHEPKTSAARCMQVRSSNGRLQAAGSL